MRIQIVLNVWESKAFIAKAIMTQLDYAAVGQDVTNPATWENWDISALVGALARWVMIQSTDASVTVGIRTDGSSDTPTTPETPLTGWVKTSAAGIIEIYCSAAGNGDFRVLNYLENVT